MAYCDTTDLLIGDTRLPSNVDPQAYVNAAADEIDGAIGFKYATPIALDETVAVNRPVMLLLKTINAWLATGRILLTISRSSEDSSLDALGTYYVKGALDRVAQIVDGKILLVNAVENTVGLSTFKGPTIINGDSESMVDAFYGHFQRPRRRRLFPYSDPFYGDYGPDY